MVSENFWATGIRKFRRQVRQPNNVPALVSPTPASRYETILKPSESGSTPVTGISTLGRYHPDTLGKAGNFTRSRIFVEQAVTRSAHDFRLCCPKRFRCSGAIALGNGRFNLLDKGPHARAAIAVDICAARDFANGLLGRSGIGHQ